MITGIGNSQYGNYGMQKMPVKRKEMFEKADQDGDGKVTKEELAAVLPKDGKGPGVDDIFKKVDTNQDGVIDETEDAAAAKEMQRHHGPKGPPDLSQIVSELFQKADGDADGKITQDELTQALSQNGQSLNVDDLFKAADSDEDGSISKSELEDALKKIFEQMQAEFPPPPENANPSYDRTGNLKDEAASSFFLAEA